MKMSWRRRLPRVSISQSNSDLLSESKGVKVCSESPDKYPKQEESDRVYKITGKCPSSPEVDSMD